MHLYFFISKVFFSSICHCRTLAKAVPVLMIQFVKTGLQNKDIAVCEVLLSLFRDKGKIFFVVLSQT